MFHPTNQSLSCAISSVRFSVRSGLDVSAALRDDELPAFITADEEEVTGDDGGGAGHVTGFVRFDVRWKHEPYRKQKDSGNWCVLGGEGQNQTGPIKSQLYFQFHNS